MLAPPDEHARSKMFPLICLAIGVYSIVFPEALLDDPAYAKLPMRSFGTALGLLFVAGGVAFHARQSRGRTHVLRVICGVVATAAFAYMIGCIVVVEGWPR